MGSIYDYIVAVVAEFDQFFSFDQTDSLKANMAVIGMERMVKKLIGSEFLCDSFSDARGRIVFLLHYDPANSRLINQYNIHSVFKSLQTEVYETFGRTISVGIGDCQENGFQKSYDQALMALEQKFYYGENSIISFLDVPEDRNEGSEQGFQSFQEQLCRALEEEDFNKAMEITEDYSAGLQKEKQMRPLVLKQHMMEFLLYMYKGKRLGDARFVLDLIREVKQAETLNQLMQWMKALCQDILEKTERNKAAGIRISVQKVKDYINKNYGEEISLKRMAESVYVSQSYLSYAFKEITGVHFNEYLTSVRMEKAKELLRTTDYRVYEVCELVGYRDKKYFTDLFRRYTGMLPREWARKKQQVS